MKPKNWEYLRDSDLTVEEMNALGSFGWELVSAFDEPGAEGSTQWFFFKRDKAENKKRLAAAGRSRRKCKAPL